MSRFLALSLLMVFSMVSLSVAGCPPRQAVPRPPGFYDYQKPEHGEDQAAPESAETEAEFSAAVKAAAQGEAGAAAMLRRFIQKHPQSRHVGRAALTLGGIELERHQTHPGQVRLEEVERILLPTLGQVQGTDRINALLLKARLRYLQGDFATCSQAALEGANHARELLGKVSEAEDLMATARIQEGECLLQQSRYTPALRAFSLAYPDLGNPELRQYARDRARHIVFEEMDGATAASIRGRMDTPMAEAYLSARGAISAAMRGDAALAADSISTAEEWLQGNDDEATGEMLQTLVNWYGARSAISSKAPVIGLVLPLEGQSRRIGWRMLWGALLASGSMGEDRDQTIGLVIRDSGSTIEETVAIVSDLAENDNVLAVVGPSDVRLAHGAAAAAQKAGLPIITLTVDPSLPPRGDLVFRNFVDADREVAAVLAYLKAALPEGGLHGAAIIAPDIPYGNNMAQLFATRAEEEGIPVVVDTRYPATGFEFKDALEALVESPATVSAIFIPDTPQRVASLTAHLAARGYWSLPAGEQTPEVAEGEPALHPVQLMGTSAWYDHGLFQKAGRYIRGAVLPVGFFAEGDSSSVVDFVTDSLSAQDSTPDYLQAYAYDSISLVGQLLAHPENRSRSALAQALRATADWVGVTGTKGFDPSGNPIGDLFLVVVDENGFSVAPPPQPAPPEEDDEDEGSSF